VRQAPAHPAPGDGFGDTLVAMAASLAPVPLPAISRALP